MQQHDGAWVGWDGGPDGPSEPFDQDGMTLVPVPLSAEEIEEFYEGFSNGTLWPLYHDVVAKPEFHREWWDVLRHGQPALRRDGRRARRRERPGLGARLPAAAGARRCCASCAPTCGSASSCTSRSRPPSSSCSCRGGGRSSRACSAPTWSASSAPAARENFVRLVRQRVGHKTHRDLVYLPDGRTRARPPRSRSRSTTRASPSCPVSDAVRRPRQGDPRAARQPAAGAARRRPARLHQGHLQAAQGVRRAAGRGRAQRRGRGVRPGGDAVPRARRRVPPAARRDRPARRPHQRRLRPDRPAGDPLPALVVPPRRDGGDVPRRRRHGGDSAARRHEPGRQGVRRLPRDRGRRAGALGVRRRGRRAQAGVPGEPLRHRRHEGDDPPGLPRPAQGPQPPDAGDAQDRAGRTTSSTGPTSSSAGSARSVRRTASGCGRPRGATLGRRPGRPRTPTRARRPVGSMRAWI